MADLDARGKVAPEADRLIYREPEGRFSRPLRHALSLGEQPTMQLLDRLIKIVRVALKATQFRKGARLAIAPLLCVYASCNQLQKQLEGSGARAAAIVRRMGASATATSLAVIFVQPDILGGVRTR
jgi:hypothetical protein